MAATAETQTSGVIASDTIWTVAQSPYTVTGDITVNNGAVLTIEAGTTVYMNPGVNLIVNNGALRAKGVANAPIIITSANDIQNGAPSPGSWGQILFQDNTNDANTIVEWTQIRYGNGLRIASASPTLNYLTIQNHTGPAISIDLKSSPVGVGLKATGNTLNGISVPAGEVTDSVKWLLQGIPYVITQGEVSVGKKPVIIGISPASIQQGATIDAVIAGTRLAGVESVSFDAAGVTATLSPGANDASIPLRINANATQPLGNVPFEVQMAAGRVRFDSGITIIPTKPTIGVSSLSPAALRRGESKSLQIIGSSLQGAQISPPAGSGLTVSSLTTTETQATFTLRASASAVLGPQVLTLVNPAIANGTTTTVTVNPALPQVYTSPSTLVTPPDGKLHSFFVQISNSDIVPHTLNLSMSDPTIATISPSTVTIPAGSSQSAISITGLKLGTTLLNITSPTLATVNVQTYVTNALNGASVGPVLSPIAGVDRPLDPTSLPVGAVLGPIVSSAVGVDRPLDVALPVGTFIGPIVSHPVGVDRPLDPTSLPVGAVLGPIVSSAVGVDRPLDVALPVGTVIGPIVSPIVGLDK